MKDCVSHLNRKNLLKCNNLKKQKRIILFYQVQAKKKFHNGINHEVKSTVEPPSMDTSLQRTPSNKKRCFCPEVQYEKDATSIHGGGGGFFHSKGTWGCAAREGILFRTSSLAKGVLFGNFSRVRSRQGYAFWEIWSKRCQNSVIFVKTTELLKNFGLENAKIWQVLPRKANSEHF